MSHADLGRAAPRGAPDRVGRCASACSGRWRSAPTRANRSRSPVPGCAPCWSGSPSTRAGWSPPGQLVDALWADDPPAGATNALQALVSRLRRAVPDLAVESHPAGYRLALDAGRGRRAPVRGAAQAGALRRGPADEALALWRGPALAEVADADFARGPAARLTELRLGAVERRRCELARRRPAPVAELEALSRGTPDPGAPDRRGSCGRWTGPGGRPTRWRRTSGPASAIADRAGRRPLGRAGRAAPGRPAWTRRRRRPAPPGRTCGPA